MSMRTDLRLARLRLPMDTISESLTTAYVCLGVVVGQRGGERVCWMDGHCLAQELVARETLYVHRW